MRTCLCFHPAQHRSREACACHTSAFFLRGVCACLVNYVGFPKLRLLLASGILFTPLHLPGVCSIPLPHHCPPIITQSVISVQVLSPVRCCLSSPIWFGTPHLFLPLQRGYSLTALVLQIQIIVYILNNVLPLCKSTLCIIYMDSYIIFIASFYIIG